MAHNFKSSTASANAEANALGALFNGASLQIYDGAQPVDADTAVGAQVLLAVLTLANPAFGAAVAGVITANAIAQDVSADATGTAAWFRCVTPGGVKLCDGSVGTAGADCNLNAVAIVAGTIVAMTSMVLTQGKV